MRSRWFGFVLAALAAAAAVWAYPRLPDRVATHWNLYGEPDGWSGRLFASLFGPVLIVALTALFQVLPKIDPKGENYAKFGDAYWGLVNPILLFLAALHLAVLANGLGYAVAIARLVPLGIGLLFVVLGFYLGRVEPNWFVGVRTPWTLSSETVWRATHRTAATLFLLGGLVIMAASFLPALPAFVAVMAIIGVIVVIPVVQSYVLWKRERSAGTQ